MAVARAYTNKQGLLQWMKIHSLTAHSRTLIQADNNRFWQVFGGVRWDKSPKRSPPSWQNACDEGVSGWEKRKVVDEETVRQTANNVNIVVISLISLPLSLSLAISTLSSLCFSLLSIQSASNSNLCFFST